MTPARQPIQVVQQGYDGVVRNTYAVSPNIESRRQPYNQNNSNFLNPRNNSQQPPLHSITEAPRSSNLIQSRIMNLLPATTQTATFLNNPSSHTPNSNFNRQPRVVSVTTRIRNSSTTHAPQRSTSSSSSRRQPLITTETKVIMSSNKEPQHYQNPQLYSQNFMSNQDEQRETADVLIRSIPDQTKFNTENHGTPSRTQVRQINMSHQPLEYNNGFGGFV